MKQRRKLWGLNGCLQLLLFCSCARTPAADVAAPAPGLPPDVTINAGAGRGDWLMVTLRLKGGEELPCVVDTGAQATILDKSLEPKLGKRLGKATVYNFGTKHKAGIYSSPNLYLGNRLLRTGDKVFTLNMKKMSPVSEPPTLGILGLDCLRYYCIQLDFEAGKMRFLDPVRLDLAKLGKVFPLSLTGIRTSSGELMMPSISCCSLIGGDPTDLLIDTGYARDGALESGVFRRCVLERKLRVEGDVIRCQEPGRAWFEKCRWNGATYTNLLIGDGGTGPFIGNGENLVGLGFLARHLVTLNFPTRALYLKQTRIGPLVDENGETAAVFLNQLKATDRLPGWSSTDKGTIYCHAHLKGAVFDGRKNGDTSIYHYRIVRASKDKPWKLEKAWRADQDNRTVQRYPVP